MREDVYMTRRKRRTFTDQQKADAVRMAREVGNVAQVARDLDLTENTLRNWIKKADAQQDPEGDGALSKEERDELRRLRKENRVLQMERDFLKKAAAFFAKEDDQLTN